MKKLTMLLMSLAVFAMVSCGESTSVESTEIDSTSVSVDTITATVDTVAVYIIHCTVN